MKSKRWIGSLVVGAVLAGTPSFARADEGMWTFNNVPKETLKKKYGFDATDAWLEKVQKASVRFNSGGSGSFVSPNGLVMTNHHIASDTLGKISTADHDYFKTGFLAKSYEEEVKAPDLELNVLWSIEDVTDRVNAAIASAKPEDAVAKRRAVISEIEKASLEKTGLRSDVVTLYKGARYDLYRYKRYTDVRLVFAPEFDVAFFGGDPDNFTYPRYDLDVALFRVYENGKPATIEHYFEWSGNGAKDGDLVFVAGSPGSTSRLNTMAHLAFVRDVQYPFLTRMFEDLRETLYAYAKKGEEQERQVHDAIFGVENRLKVYRGESAGLADAALMKRRAAHEAALRTSVDAKEASKRAYGDAWSAIEASRGSLSKYYKPYVFFESGRAFDSDLFRIARTLVRLAEENEKPNGERLREYSDAGRASLELSLYSPAPIYPELEKATLAGSLRFLVAEMGESDELVKRILDGKSPEARAAELVDGTKLADVAERKRIAADGKKGIAESSDAMIQLAHLVDARSRELRERYEREVSGPEEIAYAKIARALYDVEGAKLYPDATFTLRLAFGTVKGYEEDGKQIAPHTTFEGMYRRAAAAGNAAPYHLPERWLERKKAVDLETPVNFVTTADTIGGNSGSPLINRDAEIVGLNFDRNIHGLVRNFVYDETRARNVAVDSRGILEALRSIYGADNVVKELTGK